MAKIWSWSGAAHSNLHAHIEYIRTTTFEPGLNLFAQVAITRFVVDPAAGAAASVQATISRYAVWNADGSHAETAMNDQPSAAFIRNCAWVEMALGVVRGQASASLTLIEWT